MALSAAGFGYQMSWEDEEVPPGHALSFKRAVEIVTAGVFLHYLCPKWVFEWAPTKRIREVRDGYAEFRVRSLRARPTYCHSSAENGIWNCAVVFGGDD
jgi:hypothetical protein